MTLFVKPEVGAAYDELGSQAVRLALSDAGIDYSKIQQAYAGWVYGDSTAGQTVLYKVGMTGIPILEKTSRFFMV